LVTGSAAGRESGPTSGIEGSLEPTTIRRTPRSVMHYNCLALNQWVRDNRLSLYQLSHGGMCSR